MLRFALAALLGALGAAAFPLVVPGLGDTPLLDFLPREMLIVVMAVGLYHALHGARPTIYFAVCGFGYFAVLLHWIDIAMSRFGGMPQWQAIPALTALLLLCSLFCAAIPQVAYLLRRHGHLPRPLAFAMAVVALDFCRSALTGFPWGLWGYSQARNLPILQLASVAGVYGITFLIALVGAFARNALQFWGTRRGWHYAASTAATVGLSWLVGALLLSAQPDASSDAPARIAIVQGNIEQHIKNHDATYQATILQTYNRLSLQAKQQGADIVIWPEGAWPLTIAVDRVSLPLPKLAVFWLIGAVTYQHVPLQLWNSALWLDADGVIGDRYHKQHLVPFGEYVPLRRLMPFNMLDKVVPGLVDYSSGSTSEPLGPRRIGVLICYDGVFPHVARASVRAGAQWLVNLTNDGWYGISSGPFQHRDFYAFRAVETGRWLARAANSGLSFFVDPHGRMHQSTSLDTAATTVQNIPSSQSTTFYVQTGEWLVALCLGTLLGALGNAAYSRYRPPLASSQRFW